MKNNIHCKNMPASTKYLNQSSERCKTRFVAAQDYNCVEELYPCKSCSAYLEFWLQEKEIL